MLGISGSPRKGGNTDALLDAALKGAENSSASVEKLYLCDLKISPCQECHQCEETGECVIDDEMQSIYPKLIEADMLFLASPIFFMGIPAQTKVMIDRCQCIWVRRYKMNQTIGRGREFRKGFFISVGGSKNPEKFIGAVKTVKAFFATLDFTYEKELLVAGVDEKGAIRKHPTALKEARRLGKEFITLISK